MSLTLALGNAIREAAQGQRVGVRQGEVIFTISELRDIGRKWLAPWEPKVIAMLLARLASDTPVTLATFGSDVGHAPPLEVSYRSPFVILRRQTQGKAGPK